MRTFLITQHTLRFRCIPLVRTFCVGTHLDNGVCSSTCHSVTPRVKSPSIVARRSQRASISEISRSVLSCTVAGIISRVNPVAAVLSLCLLVLIEKGEKIRFFFVYFLVEIFEFR